jgi:glucan phosphoethanolaminetransferase (alkaline phosphatase superfamily)
MMSDHLKESQNPEKKILELSKNAINLGIFSVVLLLGSALLVYIGTFMPFLILLTGPIAFVFALASFIAGSNGMSFSIRAIRNHENKKPTLWIGLAMNLLTLLVLFSICLWSVVTMIAP